MALRQLQCRHVSNFRSKRALKSIPKTVLESERCGHTFETTVRMLQIHMSKNRGRVSHPRIQQEQQWLRFAEILQVQVGPKEQRLVKAGFTVLASSSV